MFKRPRLRPTRSLVNVSIAACAIFISACGDSEPAIDTETEVETPVLPALEAENPNRLQAVWGTRSLSAEIVDIALSGGQNPLLAAVLEGGQMQMFDLDGEQLSALNDVGIAAIAQGQSVALGETRLAMFPGIGTDGAVNIYVYSAELGRPVAIDLLPSANAAGICAGPAEDDSALIEIGYWTDAAPDTLVMGEVFEREEIFVWEKPSTLSFGDPIGACLLSKPGTTTISGTQAAGIVELVQGETRKRVQLNVSGFLEDTTDTNSLAPLIVRDGISVRVPEPIVALAALSDAQFGGYPNGVIVLGGQVDGAPKLVFVEPIGELAPVGAPEAAPE